MRQKGPILRPSRRESDRRISQMLLNAEIRNIGFRICTKILPQAKALSSYIWHNTLLVWPDSYIKSSPIFKNLPKWLPMRFLPEKWCFQNSPKITLHLGYFVTNSFTQKFAQSGHTLLLTVFPHGLKISSTLTHWLVVRGSKSTYNVQFALHHTNSIETSKYSLTK